MSAFIVSKAHIDALVDVALNGPRDVSRRWEGGPRWEAFDPRDTHWPEQEWRQCAQSGTGNSSVKAVTPDELGEMLVVENVRSITARYPDVLDGGPMPGPVDAYWESYYEFQRPSRRPTVVEALKLISCYEYQSCEHDEWVDSEAKRFCEHLTATLIGFLAGYDEAPWEWDQVAA